MIAANPTTWRSSRRRDKAFNALVGQAMKASKGKPTSRVNELLRKRLEG